MNSPFKTQKEFIDDACQSFRCMLEGYMTRDSQLYALARQNVETMLLPDVLCDIRELPRE